MIFYAITIVYIFLRLFSVYGGHEFSTGIHRGGNMKDLVEIRWHGRGGQGAKTAALLLADVAFSTGMHVQGFPEYGPERMGAPITAYTV